MTAGGMVAEFVAVDARFVALTIHQLAGKITLVDELLVEPAASLTDNARCRLSPAPSGADAAGGRLLDLCYQPGGSSPDRSVVWATDQQATIELALREPRHLGLVRLHTPQPESIGQLDVLAQRDGASGWHGQNVEVTPDLGRDCTIDAVRVHREGGGCGAVGFPPRIDVLVSPDGRAWSWVASIGQSPEKLLVDRPADHVRLEFQRRGWLMLDEVEGFNSGESSWPSANRLQPKR